MTELEALRHQVKQLEAQLIDEREQAYRANLRDVELCQKAQRERDMLQAALWSHPLAAVGAGVAVLQRVDGVGGGVVAARRHGFTSSLARVSGVRSASRKHCDRITPPCAQSTRT